MRADADRGREHVSGEVPWRCGVTCRAVAAVARARDLDDRIDVRCVYRMATRALVARMARWRCTVAVVARTRDQIAPLRARAYAAGGEHITVAVHVGARSVDVLRRSSAKCRDRRCSRPRTEHDLGGGFIAYAGLQDVAIVIPAIRYDVALGTIDIGLAMAPMLRRLVFIAMACRARRRLVVVAIHARCLGATTAEIFSMTARAQRVVVVAPGELAPVERVAVLVEDTWWMDTACHVGLGTWSFLCAAREQRDDDRDPHGMPWTTLTSSILPGP